MIQILSNIGFVMFFISYIAFMSLINAEKLDSAISWIPITIIGGILMITCGFVS